MATIRCGKCGQTHSSVAEVRACYGATVPTQPSANIFAAPPVIAPRIASTNKGLIAELNGLRARVESGHYAVQDGSKLRFLRVNVTMRNGDRFVYLDEQASDELYPVRSALRQIALLRLILADPHAALVRYGHEIGRCGVCNRTLTDADSRAAGIGPTCASRLS